MGDKHLWFAVLLISSASISSGRGSPTGTAASGKGSDTKPRMEMAFDALDDQYDECEDNMKKLVEENIPDSFKKVWDTTKKEKMTGDKGLSEDHRTAILVYKKIQKEFNKETIMGGMNYNTFPYKKLHFYLTDAIKTLLKKTQQSECHNVHLVSKQEIVADTAEVIRFGQFVTTDKTAPKPGKTHFIIKTCSGVAFDTLGEGLILIPPYEVFNVTAVKGQDIHLDHLDDMSIQNCLGAPKPVPKNEESISGKIMRINMKTNLHGSDIKVSQKKKHHKRHLQTLKLPWDTTGMRLRGAVPIPVVISIKQAFPNQAAHDRNHRMIQRALSSIRRHTCIDFTAWRGQNRYIKITSVPGDDRCCTDWYPDGDWKWPIEIHLGPDCFDLGVIQHELMHALGFDHEHCRHDRNNFITVDLTNVPQEWHDQYAVNNFRNKGLPYDYTSIMHYPSSLNLGNGVTIPGVITPHQAGQPIGISAEMNDQDIERIKRFYRCASTARNPPPWLP